MEGRLQNEMRIQRKTTEKVQELPDYVNRWYLNLKASRKTAATCNDYMNKVRRFLSSINSDVKSVRLDEINESSVTEYFLSIQTRSTKSGTAYTSDSYQCTVWCCLDNFLEFLYKNRYIPKNYIKDIDRPKNRDLVRINEKRILLTAEDFKKILDATNDEKREFIRRRDYAILLLFMNTGMRETALASITTDNLDYVNRKLSIMDKGGIRHTYSINEKLLIAIFDWYRVCGVNHDSHMFFTDKGTGLSVAAIAKLVAKYSKKALGYSISPHKLRSGYCSILYNQTKDIEFVRRCVGHANVSTTQRYIVTKGAEKEKAAEIMADLL